MRIISNDNYFIGGLKAIAEEMSAVNTRHLVIFDTGLRSAYIFDSGELRRNRIFDPYSALLHCRSFYFNRDVPLETYAYYLAGHRVNALGRSRLTEREEWAIRVMCGESDADDMAELLCFNRKTYSSHKVKALRKLGIRNALTLNSLLRVWKKNWPALCPKTQREGDFSRYSVVNATSQVSNA
ncbi:hypothetical protein [uncultured Enterobacter sp.]|uniref:hypothetical protein n=1 Tax=uncultured Enterobacter sp. TaxID=238202 RepID=UPI00261A26D3|nr:hypothetical protein [uncultured Enterobacter sp.]